MHEKLKSRTKRMVLLKYFKNNMHKSKNNFIFWTAKIMYDAGTLLHYQNFCSIAYHV